MKITFNKIADGVTMLFKIKELNLSIPVDYWCTKNIKILLDDYRYFIEKRDEIYDKHCNKDENEQYYRIEDNAIIFSLKEDCKVDNFNDEMNKLLTNECEVNPFVMPMSTLESLPNFKIDGCNSDMIDFLLP